MNSILVLISVLLGLAIELVQLLTTTRGLLMLILLLALAVAVYRVLVQLKGR